MSTVLHALESAPPLLVYVFVGLLVFGEAAAFVGLVLPGETALLLGGTLAAVGRASLPVLLATAVLAAIAGDSVGFLVGRSLGSRTRTSRAGRWIGAERWTRAEQVVLRRGALAVLGGRWVGLLRALVPALAGMSGMRFRTYLLYNVLGGVLWVSVVVLGSYLLGATLGASALSVLSGSILGVSILVVVVHQVVRRRRARTASAAGPGSGPGPLVPSPVACSTPTPG